VARDVLAVWEHLRRFPPEYAADDRAVRLERLVRGDAENLAAAALGRPFAAAWTDRVWQLARDRDCAEAAEVLEECDQRARELFEELDRHDLAAYAAGVLLPADHTLRGRLAQRREELDEAEDLFAEEADLFATAASLTETMLAAYRPDLDHADEALWRTTLKHARLEEWKAQEVPVTLRPPTDAWWALRHGPRSPRKALAACGVLWLARGGQFRTAADASPDDEWEALRAELAAATACVEGEPRLSVGFDLLLGDGREPVGLQLRLRGPNDLRERYVRAEIHRPGQPHADVVVFEAGRGVLSLGGEGLRQALADPQGWNAELADDTGGVRALYVG
jgi:hypothetical protein